MDNETNNGQTEPAKEKKLTYEDGIRRLQETASGKAPTIV